MDKPSNGNLLDGTNFAAESERELGTNLNFE